MNIFETNVGKKEIMKRDILVLIITAFASLQFTTFTFADDGQFSIKELISDPVYYDGKEITVEGEVEKIHHTTRNGTPYTLFRMYDREQNSIGVYSKGYIPISRGTKVKVVGEFKKEKRVIIFTFKNIIKAHRVEEIV
jgi:hypothetical protein